MDCCQWHILNRNAHIYYLLNTVETHTHSRHAHEHKIIRSHAACALFQRSPGTVHICVGRVFDNRTVCTASGWISGGLTGVLVLLTVFMRQRQRHKKNNASEQHNNSNSSNSSEYSNDDD